MILLHLICNHNGWYAGFARTSGWHITLEDSKTFPPPPPLPSGISIQSMYSLICGQKSHRQHEPVRIIRPTHLPNPISRPTPHVGCSLGSLCDFIPHLNDSNNLTKQYTLQKMLWLNLDHWIKVLIIKKWNHCINNLYGTKKLG